MKKEDTRRLTTTLLEFVKEEMIDPDVCDIAMITRDGKDKPYFVNLAEFIEAVKFVIVHL